MKSVNEHAREIGSDVKAGMMWSVVVLIKQRDKEIREAAIRDCARIHMQHPPSEHFEAILALLTEE